LDERRQIAVVVRMVLLKREPPEDGKVLHEGLDDLLGRHGLERKEFVEANLLAAFVLARDC